MARKKKRKKSENKENKDYNKNNAGLYFLLFVLLVFLGVGLFFLINSYPSEIEDKELNENGEIPDEQVNVSDNHVVMIENFKFVPREITIKRGDKVTWVNTNNIKSQVIFSNHAEGLKSGKISPNGEYSYTFDEIGKYDVFSAINDIKSTVFVE